MQVRAAVAEFLTAQAQDGLSVRHCESLTHRLSYFAEAFDRPIAEVTGPDVDQWLRKMQATRAWSGRTRNHYRATISNLMGFARRRRLVLTDEMDAVSKAVEVDGEIQIFTPEAMNTLLRVIPDNLLPFVALGGFSGPRPSEIQRAAWEDLHWDSGEFFVGLGKVRTAGHRVAPFLSNCQQWLDRLCPVDQSAPIVSLKDPYKTLARVVKRAGLPWIQDGLRHSFVSYRLALTKNIQQVSEETGTDASTLRRRYRRPVKQADAEAWFRIVP